jgi:DNA polymerase-1
MKRLVLIDGHAILHRAYHAFPKTLTTRRGELVNAVYGFTRILLKVIEDLGPKYLAVALDLPKPTFRHKEYLGYQIQRPKMDEELKDQIERVNEVLRALNIPVFAVEGFEADDVIGTLSRQAAKKGIESIIVTGDKDIMQLVKPRIKVYAPVKGFSEAELLGEEKVGALLGIKPSQVVDYKALVGDPSDNYPGVSGIGPKTAVTLLRQYGDLESVYKNVQRIKPTIAEKLKAGRDSAKLSRKLAKIVTDIPIKLNLKACLVHDYDRQKAIGLFQKLEFKSLIDKLPGAEKNLEYRIKNRESRQMKLI